MKIVNPRVLEDIERRQPLRLNLGSGLRTEPGYYNLDLVELPGVDIVADLNESLSLLPDNCASEVKSLHTFEHVPNMLGLMAEVYRVLQPDGRLEVIVPHFSDPHGYSDPTHVRFFGLFSMYYFCDTDEQPPRKVPCHYSNCRFRIEQIELRFNTRGILGGVVGHVMRRLVNRGYRMQHWYERRMAWLWPAEEIRFVMRPKKPAFSNGMSSGTGASEAA